MIDNTELSHTEQSVSIQRMRVSEVFSTKWDILITSLTPSPRDIL